MGTVFAVIFVVLRPCVGALFDVDNVASDLGGLGVKPDFGFCLRFSGDFVANVTDVPVDSADGDDIVTPAEVPAWISSGEESGFFVRLFVFCFLGGSS